MSDYINAYLKESADEATKSHPDWLINFFKSFHSELSQRSNGAAAGNRYVITGAFASSFLHLLPDGVTHRKEVKLQEFSPRGIDGALFALVNSKKVDFLVQKQEARLFIEFKTNINFNDLSAAMVEIAVVKKFIATPSMDKIFTGSLHLFPYTADVEGLRELNQVMGQSLDFIWVLCCQWPSPKFDIQAICRFREDVQNCLG